MTMSNKQKGTFSRRQSVPVTGPTTKQSRVPVPKKSIGETKPCVDGETSLFSIPVFSPSKSQSMKFPNARSLRSPGAQTECPTKTKLKVFRQRSMVENSMNLSPLNVCDSPRHPPYQCHRKMDFINMTSADDEDLMVSADAFVTRAVASKTTATSKTKSSKTLGISHDALMEQLSHHASASTNGRECEYMDIHMIEQTSMMKYRPTDVTKRNAHELDLCIRGYHSTKDSIVSSKQAMRRLSRNLTLPIKAVHALDSPKNQRCSTLARRPCNSEGNTPIKPIYRSVSEIEAKQTPKKQKISSCHQTKLSRPPDYVQKLYGTLPRGKTSKDMNKNKVCQKGYVRSLDSTPRKYSCGAISCETQNSVEIDTTPYEVFPFDSPRTQRQKSKFFSFSPKRIKSAGNSPKKSPKRSMLPELISPKKKSPRKYKQYFDHEKESLTGYLFINILHGKGFSKNSDTYVVLEIDSYGHFFKKSKTKPARGSDPQWDETFEFEIEACNTLRLSCYNKLRLMGDDISGKVCINLTRENLVDGKNRSLNVSLDRGQASMNISLSFSTSMDGIKKCPSFRENGVFGVPILAVCKREKNSIPVVVISCIKEIEKRGMDEVGIYRLSGIASEIQNLKKLFNERTQNAVLALSDTDIHAVAGLLKLYFRELPQSLFTSKLYHKFVEGLSITDAEEKELYMCDVVQELPKVNRMTALYLFGHLRRVALQESQNKMGLNNLATVFGPTVLRPPSSSSVDKENERSSCNVGTFDIGALDVMSQVGIFRYFLTLKDNPRTKLPEDDLELWRRLDPEKALKLEEKLMVGAEEYLI